LLSIGLCIRLGYIWSKCRNQALTYTNAHPWDTGSLVPYLTDFSKWLHPAELPSSTGDILNSYLQYINVRGGKINLQSQAQAGFIRAFKKLAIRNKIRGLFGVR
jgi:hypothetical protein